LRERHALHTDPNCHSHQHTDEHARPDRHSSGISNRLRQRHALLTNPDQHSDQHADEYA